MSGHLPPELVFERFTVGPGNRLAATAARRAAESPGVRYNPLVICGPAGVGKTHLLASVGHLAREVEPELYVHYETLDSLVDRLSGSLADGTLAEFRDAAGGVGLLLLDDFQQVAGKARTQTELVSILEALIDRGAQVVVASDRLPHEIPALDAQLAARLAAGLIVEIADPERETRRAPEPPAGGDEFGDFVSDIATAVAAVVETDPWRRRVAEAILHWEGEGIVTRRLDAALDADSAPDVDALLDGFARDVARLRAIRGSLLDPEADPAVFADPDRLVEAERLIAASRKGAHAAAAPRAAPPATALDRWFLDREKLALDWLALDDRLIEERG